MLDFNLIMAQAQAVIPASPNLLATFFEGLLSFLAPCVLPLVPGYLSYISGVSLSDLKKTDPATSEASASEFKNFKKVLLSTLLFVAGFSTTFILFFGFLSFITDTFGDIREPLRIASGLLIIVFGLNFLGIVKLNFLNMERRMNLSKIKKASLIGAYFLGAAFAFGWSPCVGPFLTTALFSASQGSAGQGLVLMVAYSAGLGVPFVLAGLFFSRFMTFVGVARKHFHTIEVVSGLLLIVVGLLLLTGNLEQISNQLNSINLFS